MRQDISPLVVVDVAVCDVAQGFRDGGSYTATSFAFLGPTVGSVTAPQEYLRETWAE